MRLAITCVALGATAARAEPADCQVEATALRARLDDDARHAQHWELAWDVVFGATTAGSLALAITHADPIGGNRADFEESMYVGAAKSGFGLLAHLVMPLRIDVPAVAGDACADRAALRAALAEAARRERKAFWLDHLGAFAVNLAGAIVLASRRSWQVGATSAALGYPVGLLSIYTAPRASWHDWRERAPAWTVGASATTDGLSLWLAGQF
jgi:hypothetical protein